MCQILYYCDQQVPRKRYSYRNRRTNVSEQSCPRNHCWSSEKVATKRQGLHWQAHCQVCYPLQDWTCKLVPNQPNLQCIYYASKAYICCWNQNQYGLWC